MLLNCVGRNHSWSIISTHPCFECCNKMLCLLHRIPLLTRARGSTLRFCCISNVDTYVQTNKNRQEQNGGSPENNYVILDTDVGLQSN